MFWIRLCCFYKLRVHNGSFRGLKKPQKYIHRKRMLTLTMKVWLVQMVYSGGIVFTSSSEFTVILIQLRWYLIISNNLMLMAQGILGHVFIILTQVPSHHRLHLGYTQHKHSQQTQRAAYLFQNCGVLLSYVICGDSSDVIYSLFWFLVLFLGIFATGI